MDATIVVRGDHAVLPAAAGFTPRGSGRRGDARNPGRARIEGAGPAGIRLHEQRHLLGTSGRDRSPPDRRPDEANARRRAKDRGGGRTGGGPHRRRAAPRGIDPHGLGAGFARGKRAGRPRYRSPLLGTSLGVRQSDGRQEEHGHRNHMRAINAIYHAGGIAQAVESGRLKRGVMYECVKAGVPLVLAGSLRDDGPLPDTITDMNEAQDAYAEQLKGAGLVLCLGSMLHSIAIGNMLPELGENRLRRHQSGRGYESKRSRHGTSGRRRHRCRYVPRHARRNCGEDAEKSAAEV